jgi:hypothetical protein
MIIEVYTSVQSFDIGHLIVLATQFLVIYSNKKMRFLLLSNLGFGLAESMMSNSENTFGQFT